MNKVTIQVVKVISEINKSGNLSNLTTKTCMCTVTEL